MREIDVGSAVGALVACLAIALVAFGIYRTIIRARRRKLRAKGTVVRVARGGGVDAPYPFVEFFDRDGARHVFESSHKGRNNAWPVGSRVEVSYDPDDPENAELSVAE